MRGPLALLLLALLRAADVAAQPAETAAALEPVAARVRARDDVAALGLLRALPGAARETPAARYLAGRLLERADHPAEAAAAFEAADAAGLPEEVRADARERRLHALARAGRCADALSGLARLAAGSGAGASLARARQGECLLATGDAAAAVPVLRRAAAEDARDVDTFAVRYALAQALAATADRAGAVAQLRVLLVTRPDHPDASLAGEALDALGASQALSVEERLERAERLDRARRHADAVAELDVAGRPRERALLGRYLHLRGMALYRTRRRYAEAAAELGRAARLGGDTSEEDAFHAARALSRADRDAAAVRAYDRFARAHPGSARAPEAEFLAAWLELRRGRPSGEARMTRFLRAGRGSPERARDATFELAMRAFDRGRSAAAARLFERYARLGTGAMVRGRGLYWLGRARQEAGERDGAVRAYRDAAAVEPLHWYALLSRGRLAALGEDPGDAFPAAVERPAPAPLPPPPLPEPARLYAALGLVADAAAALRPHERALREAAPPDRGLEALVAAYARLGEVSRPHRLVVAEEADELARRPDPSSRWIWEAAYPRPFAAEVVPAARDNGLEAAYLWAIMRQESGYDPDAVSYADAIGLLQLLPSTAERVAAGLGLAFRREELFDPALNVRLAARYNGGLWAAFGREAPLSLAAFNAGAHRVRRWLADRGQTPLDRFVEAIPIEQTRNYVRRVTTHYARYRYLYGGAADAAPALPDTVGP